jgi:hypothetical protein
VLLTLVKKPAFHILLLFFISLTAYAQNYTITGKVFDVDSREPLPFVAVLIKGTTVGGTSDFDGRFVIKTAKIGDSIVASYMGYKKTTRAIKVGVNQEVNMPMVLEGVNLLEVVIKPGENPAHRIIRLSSI